MTYNDFPVSIPQLCAPREDLLNTFEQRAQKQYIYINAAGGYGKTISTLLWLNKTNRIYSWMFFDEYDNMLPMFYRSLCRSILAASLSAWEDSTEPNQNNELLDAVGTPAFAASPVEIAMEIISTIKWKPGKYALVLDDFHYIVDNEILKSLPYVLKRLPSFVNVLFLSRMPLPNVMHMIADNDKTSFIVSDELKFTPEEIRIHFINYGRFVSIEHAEEIQSRTDGWVIILNAMLLSDSQRFSQKDTSLTLEDFFEKNIWQSFDEETQTFLIKSSVVDSFSLSLCTLLTGYENPSAVLDSLIRGNINISCMEQEYRYHNLFLNYLRKKGADSAVDINSIYKTAAEYYLDNNEIITGRCYAVKSGDSGTILRGAAAISQVNTISYDEYMGLQTILGDDQLPDDVLDKMPVLYMQKMYVAYLNGNRFDFEHCWDRLYDLLPVIAEKYPKFMQKIAVNSILDYRVQFTKFVEHIHDMPEFPYEDDEESEMVTNIGIQMPFLHRSSRDCYECSDENVREEVVAGAFRQLIKNDYDALFSGIRAGLYYEQNRLDEAWDVLLKSEAALNDNVSLDLGWATYVMLAETAFHRGMKSEYNNYKEQAKEYFESRLAYYYNKNFSAYETRMLLWDGDKDEAQSWLDCYFINESNFGVLYKIFQNFTTARAYIVLGQSENALNALYKIKALAEDFDRLLDIAEAEILISIVEWASGKKKESQDRLRKLLIALFPYGFIRIVANEGKAVLPILTAILKKFDKEGEKDGSLYRYIKEIHIAAYECSKKYKGLTYGFPVKTVSLSPKQTLVIELLSKGHSNAEIVKITGLSINTIREHTRNAYRKLEVTNAMDAIVRAKELGILK